MSEQPSSEAGIGPGNATSGDKRGLRFEILGPIRVTLKGSAVNLGGAQQRAVLALLLIDHDTPVTVARIADAVWDGRPPPRHATTIQTYVFHLREALEPDRPRGSPGRVIVSERGGYRLDTNGAAIDAREFERLAHSGLELVRTGEHERALPELDAALALWRGDVFADVAELEAVAPVAVGLNELRLTAVEARIDALLALGRHKVAVGELDQLTTANPLRERLYAQRMLALYRCGRQADALAAYRHLRQVLDNEVGVEPSPPLRELHQAILTHDPSLTDGLPSADTKRESAPDLPSTPAPATTRRPPRRRRRLLAASVAAVVAAGTAVAVVMTHGEHSSLKALPPNSAGVVHADGSLHDAVPVGQSPTAIAYADGSVWVANGGTNTVMRINPRTHEVVREILVGGDPVAIAATSSTVWVVNAADGTVDRINTAVNRVVGEPIKVGNQPGAIAAGPSGVWVANTGDDTVQRIDPDSYDVGKPIEVGGRPSGIAAVNADSVWVANGFDRTVSQVDPHTGIVRAPIQVGAGPAGLAVVDGSVWVANALEQSVSRIDPATGATVDTIPDVGDGPTAVASDGRYLWVAASHSATVARIDLRRRDVRRFVVGASPVALTTVGSSVYVASQAFASAGHVGGTLTVGTTDIPGGSTGIDPASLYYWWTAAGERFVYDGLVAFRGANGAAGFTLVPDLAARMPTVSQDGKTYSFTLRTGIRYSTGRIVQAQDFTRGFRRVFTVARTANPYLFNGVVGAAHCLSHPTTCDLSRGVIADDVRHRLSIQLTAPDADFLHKLACLVFPAPPGTSGKQVARSPVPGTGPYQIQAAHQRFNKAVHTTETTFDTLIRNPYFRQWSFAAQPAGYPDVIKFHKYSRAEDAVKAVRAGTVDVGAVAGGDSAKLGALVAGLRVHDPDRLHALTRPDKWWVALNTQVPPFDNKLARQAVNYAVDREQLITDVFGAGLVEPSCQLLPPNFPGHAWYCPYTRAGPKPYNGPDLNKAKHLVAQSGTRGAQVTVYGIVGQPSERAPAGLAKVLRDIGYKASIRLVPDTPHNEALPYDPRNGVQVFAPDGWIADYPGPDTYYEPLLSCRAEYLNPPGFCNEHIDDLAVAARRTALTDPAAARRLWTEIDRAVTDEAPWVTLGGDVTYQFTSSRVGNYQSTPFNPLYDQLWVK
jgi:ABC-type transport system substrate-binding protein/DNA-binding SARP family transcriptional activator/streptogramin lyase